MENKIQIVFLPLASNSVEGRHKEVRKSMDEETA